MGIAGYVHFPRGRRFARFLMINALRGDVGARWPALLASALHYSPEDTSEEDIFLQQTSYRRELAGIAVCRRQDPWFACLGNYTAPSVDNRWGTDRQSFVSLWHRRSGLIIGGGNSRNQPEAGNLCWDRDDRTLYVPDAIEAVPGDDSDAVILSLGAHRVEFRARSGDDRSTVTIRLLSDAPADGLRAGLPLRIVPGSPLKVDGNDYLPPEAGLRAQAHGSMTVAHGAWRIRVPDGCTVVYPVKPFNPYHPDGDAPPEDFRAAIVLPLTGVREYEVGIEVP